MIMKFMVQYGSIFDYYATKEEAITDAINDARLGIRTANFLFKLNEETKEYEKIGEFGRKWGKEYEKILYRTGNSRGRKFRM